jgi:hypothetical protein
MNIYIKLDDPFFEEVFCGKFRNFILEKDGKIFTIAIPELLRIFKRYHDEVWFSEICDKGEQMDKKILKLKKKVDKGMDALVKEDKPRDKKLHKCDKMMKKSKRK